MESCIKETRGLGKPPKGVEDVLAAVGYLVTNTKKKMNWKDSQKMMSDPARFLQMMQSLDLDSVTADTLQKIKPITSQEFFTYDIMIGRSLAAAAMCQWVLAVQEYAEC